MSDLTARLLTRLQQLVDCSDDRWRLCLACALARQAGQVPELPRGLGEQEATDAVRTLVRWGYTRPAAELLEAMAPGDARSWCTMLVGSQLAGEGDLELARALAGQTSAPAHRLGIWLALAEAGAGPSSQEIVTQIELAHPGLPLARALALARLAAARGKTGQTREAGKLFKRAISQGHKARRSELTVVSWYPRAVQFGGFTREQALQRLAWLRGRIRGTPCLASAYLELGELETAAQVAREKPGSFDDGFRARVAVSLACPGSETGRELLREVLEAGPGGDPHGAWHEALRMGEVARVLWCWAEAREAEELFGKTMHRAGELIEQHREVTGFRPGQVLVAPLDPLTRSPVPPQARRPMVRLALEQAGGVELGEEDRLVLAQAALWADLPEEAEQLARSSPATLERLLRMLLDLGA